MADWAYPALDCSRGMPSADKQGGITSESGEYGNELGCGLWLNINSPQSCGSLRMGIQVSRRLLRAYRAESAYITLTRLS
jgi:hypothetical protein